MKIFFATLTALLALPLLAGAQAAAENETDRSATLNSLRVLRENLRHETTISHSGQFIVSAPASLAPPPPRLATDPALITLDPKLLVVSAERVKQGVWRLLEAQTPWRGKITLNLRTARSADDPIAVLVDKRAGGWAYQVELPNCMERTRFVRTLVDLVLLEMANRNAGTRSVEIPTWLAEGLSQELFLAEGQTLILPPPDRMENGPNYRLYEFNARRTNAVAFAEEALRQRPALTYEQLSWPSDDNLYGDGGAIYRSSAQLFVDQLLDLPNGPASLRTMLESLAYYYNWQFAFFHGFETRFGSALDVEKWWALQLTRFAGRDMLEFWTTEESWKRLDELVHSPVEVRSGPSDLPLRAEVNLQTVVREWDLISQERILQRKLQGLQLLRLRVAQNLAVLVDDYRETLGVYLQKRYARGRLLPWRKTTGKLVDRDTEEMVHALDALDARRLALKPASAGSLTIASDGSSTDHR